MKNDCKLLLVNRELILAFDSDLMARGITDIRRTKYLNILPRISNLLGKSFREATKKDIKGIVVTVRSLKLAEWTKSDILICLKRFFNYLYDMAPGQQPAQTAWIKVKRVKGRLLPEQLLTEQDVKKLVEECENSRDKAFVLALYESGGRIAELLNLRRKHVTFDSYGAVLLVSGKTGDRRVRIITSAPALAQWLSDNPDKNADSPLWTIVGDRNHGEPFLYDSARALLKRLAKRAQISKPINPHTFRHSRASALANHLTERQMEQYLGWSTGSRMPNIYVHLSGRDVDRALLEMHGLTQKETPKSILQPRMCPRCNESNSPGNQFCNKCGLPLELPVALRAERMRSQADSIMNILIEDPEVKQLLLSKLRMMEFQGSDHHEPD